jgi:hypothetical protein
MVTMRPNGRGNDPRIADEKPGGGAGERRAASTGLLRGCLLPAPFDFLRGREAANGALRMIFVAAEFLATGSGHRLHSLLATRAVRLGEGAELPATRGADEGLQNDCFHPQDSFRDHRT